MPPEEGYNLALPADPQSSTLRTLFKSFAVLPRETLTHTARHAYQQHSFPETSQDNCTEWARPDSRWYRGEDSLLLYVKQVKHVVGTVYATSQDESVKCPMVMSPRNGDVIT